MKLRTCVCTQFTECANNREFRFICQSQLPHGYYQRLLLNMDRRVHWTPRAKFVLFSFRYQIRHFTAILYVSEMLQWSTVSPWRQELSYVSVTKVCNWKYLCIVNETGKKNNVAVSSIILFVRFHRCLQPFCGRIETFIVCATCFAPSGCTSLAFWNCQYWLN